VSDRLTIGVLYGSDTAHLPEHADGFGGLGIDLVGHNDAPRLIDARRAEIVPLLVTPDYLSRNWRYDFSRFDVIFNSMADADLNASALLVAISALGGAATPIVNDPRHVVRTRRDIVARMLANIDGLTVPKTVRVLPGESASKLAAEQGMRYPLLLRGAGSHTGVGLQRLDTPAELDQAVAARGTSLTFYLTEFVDCRGPDGLYRKMRLMVCGETLLMRHHLFSPEWVINSAAQAFMEDRPDLLEFERLAAADPMRVLSPAGAEALARIKSRVGLDYFGIDCAQLSDGRLVIFEVNAVMNMLPASRHRIRGPFTVAAIGRIAQDLNALLAHRARKLSAA
jgi:glutathione synthase/RimK-type ligase-like ATP-grasp enzyme